MIAGSMNIVPIDVLWLFIVVLSVQAVLKHRLVEASRRRLAANTETEVRITRDSARASGGGS
jgi:hypothetical protein